MLIGPNKDELDLERVCLSDIKWLSLSIRLGDTSIENVLKSSSK